MVAVGVFFWGFFGVFVGHVERRGKKKSRGRGKQKLGERGEFAEPIAPLRRTKNRLIKSRTCAVEEQASPRKDESTRGGGHNQTVTG